MPTGSHSTVPHGPEGARVFSDHAEIPECWRVPEELLCASRNSLIAPAIFTAWVSVAKCPVSKNWTLAFGKSLRNASAPAGVKKGSFLPQIASRGGFAVRKYS